MKSIKENFIFAKIPLKVWRFNLLWLGGWSLILIATSVFFWFEKVQSSLPIYSYLLPLGLFFVNAFVYPLVKKLKDFLKVSYLNWIIITNGASGKTRGNVQVITQQEVHPDLVCGHLKSSSW